MKLQLINWTVIALLVLSGCAGRQKAPLLGDLYSRSARYHDVERNPIIVIPGILGSKLIQQGTGRIVWGAFGGGYARPDTPEGARLISLPMQKERSLSGLTDDVYPAGALDRLRVDLLGMPIELNAYQNILSSLGVGGYRDESFGRSGYIDYGEDHFTCFQFDYDWRRDNVENARRLHEFIREKRRYVQSEYEKRWGIRNYPVKFDIIAHSMGGLIARYYLRYGPADLPPGDALPELTWAGAEYLDRLILIGPPNAGSVEALIYLIQGRKFGPTLPHYSALILGTMPSLYQLLPRPRHGAVVWLRDDARQPVDIRDPAVWEKLGWGLAGNRQETVLAALLPQVASATERHAIARAHLRKCLRRAQQFARALDVPATPPRHISLHLIAGDALATPAVLGVDPENGRIEVVQKAPGDGTVLRSSALMDERLGSDWAPRLISPIAWRQVFFLFTEHLDMTRDPAFTDNILYLLLEDPRQIR